LIIYYAFIRWYFDSSVNYDLINDIVSALKETGKYQVELKDFLSNVGYLPLDMINNANIIDGEDIDNDALENITNYNLEFDNDLKNKED
jgi:hypothetical protein